MSENNSIDSILIEQDNKEIKMLFKEAKIILDESSMASDISSISDTSFDSIKEFNSDHPIILNALPDSNNTSTEDKNKQCGKAKITVNNSIESEISSISDSSFDTCEPQIELDRPIVFEDPPGPENTRDDNSDKEGKQEAKTALDDSMESEISSFSNCSLDPSKTQLDSDCPIALEYPPGFENTKGDDSDFTDEIIDLRKKFSRRCLETDWTTVTGQIIPPSPFAVSQQAESLGIMTDIETTDEEQSNEIESRELLSAAGDSPDSPIGQANKFIAIQDLVDSVIPMLNENSHKCVVHSSISLILFVKSQLLSSGHENVANMVENINEVVQHLRERI